MYPVWYTALTGNNTFLPYDSDNMELVKYNYGQAHVKVLQLCQTVASMISVQHMHKGPYRALHMLTAVSQLSSA